MPGWLVLVPRRHVEAVSELSEEEAAAMGLWQQRLSCALRDVLGCMKTYVAQFAEAEGFAHVHFHIVPRSADLPKRLRGSNIFALMGSDSSVSDEQMTTSR